MQNVSKKLLAAIAAVSGQVPKSGFNKHQNYKYVMEKDLMEAVRVALIDQGLLILPSVEFVSRAGDITTVRTKHTIIDTESGESVEAWSAGEGRDTGDKAVYKAITGATKYFLSKTFLIYGVDDPEADEITAEGQGNKGRGPDKQLKAAPPKAPEIQAPPPKAPEKQEAPAPAPGKAKAQPQQAETFSASQVIKEFSTIGVTQNDLIRAMGPIQTWTGAHNAALKSAYKAIRAQKADEKTRLKELNKLKEAVQADDDMV